MVLLGLILVLTLILLVTQVVRVEVTALALIATLGLTGLLRPEEAVTGFASSATLTVAAMLVISAGLERVGVVDWIGSLLARRAGGGGIRTVALLLATPTAGLSAFMNNTAIVALMIPVTLTLCRRLKLAPSKLLMPVSYLSILGGTCTLIGTSTNILVDSLYREAGGPGFGMFEFTRLGLLYLGAGGLFAVFVAPRILPVRHALSHALEAAAPGSFFTEVIVPRAGGLPGRRIAEVFGSDKEVVVMQLIRGEDARLGPAADTILEPGDVLVVEGTARALHDLLGRGLVVPGTAVSDEERVPIRRLDLRMVEAVILPNSLFQHRKVRDLGLSRLRGIQVLAVRRLGAHHQTELREMALQSGDVLLLQGEPESLRALQNDGDVLLIEGVERTLTFPARAPIAIATLVAVVALAAMNVAPILLLSLAGAGAVILTGCLSVPRAIRALDTSVLLLLAAMIPAGLAMERTGLAAAIAEHVVGFAGPHGPFVLVSALYLLTSLLTEVLSNNAAAVLLTPIVLQVAASLGLDPKPLLVAVAFGASASFATPIGYQTNTMVMGPGGYRFQDYLRVGLPMNALMWIVATVLIPRFWAP
ncbi:MAG: SLC13 family permease [bacterium]